MELELLSTTATAFDYSYSKLVFSLAYCYFAKLLFEFIKVYEIQRSVSARWQLWAEDLVEQGIGLLVTFQRVK